MTDTPKDQDELTEEEIERWRDRIVRRMLNTPPKPRKSKPKGKRKLGKQEKK